MNSFLKPLELAYRGINRARRALYRSGVLRSTRLPRPVISIGNLAIGGGGKTPTVIAVARLLMREGRRVAVLSRGYGRESDEPWAVVNVGDAARFGDEPVLIARSVPGLDVIVGARRAEAAAAYLRERDCDVFLLDDGFQHLQLARDVDIVLDQPRARWLREGKSALRDASIVILRGETPEPGGYAGRLEPESIVRADSVEPLDVLKGARVFAFAGLADNAQFFDTVAGAGAVLTGTRSFPDHHRYSAADVESLRRDAAGAMLMTTEKDAVKIDAADVVALRVVMRIEPEAAFREDLVTRLQKLRPVPGR